VDFYLQFSAYIYNQAQKNMQSNGKNSKKAKILPQVLKNRILNTKKGRKNHFVLGKGLRIR